MSATYAMTAASIKALPNTQYTNTRSDVDP